MNDHELILRQSLARAPTGLGAPSGTGPWVPEWIATMAGWTASGAVIGLGVSAIAHESFAKGAGIGALVGAGFGAVNLAARASG